MVSPQSRLALVLLMGGHVFAGFLIGRFFPAGEWVDQLAKPVFYPPTWAFPVAWTILYALMGVALWVFLRAPHGNKRLPLALYLVQLAVNLLYTPLCFGLESTLLGLMIVTVLWLLLAATITVFHRISRLSAWLLLPYFLWVSFALVLSQSLWRLNPG